MKAKGENQVKKALPERQHQLLFRLVNSKRKQSNKIFDKQDNCFQVSSCRKLAELSGESKSSIHRLFVTLKKEKLVKLVTDNNGVEVLMLAPHFSSRGAYFERLFMRAMFALGSYERASEWSLACRQDYTLYDYSIFDTNELIDFNTGEITYPNMVALRRLNHFEVTQWNSYRSSYSSVDRTKHRASKSA